MNNLSKHTWYRELIDECKGIMTEGVFHSRYILIETYHKVGELLRSHDDRVKITDLLTASAVDMGVSERKLWYAVKFYDKYPDLDRLPEGKNISWNKIKTKYLTEAGEPKPKYDDVPGIISFNHFNSLIKRTIASIPEDKSEDFKDGALWGVAKMQDLVE